MTTLELFADGKLLNIEKLIGRGGEGEVFALKGETGHALKVYKHPDSARESKVVAMTSAGLASLSELIAFPLAAARDRRGRFHGFTMRLVKGHQPLFELYAPGARKISFPEADYRFTVRAAANIAREIAKLHDAGVIIGDINHSGILISKKAFAALIDADSFQYGNYLCRVGVPEYTPPELQGQKLEGLSRTAEHDAFGLAVVIFQLLFMGRHPFVGRYARGEMPIEKAIVERRFAYSQRSNVGMTPPPGACLLSELPREIGAAFEEAFGQNSATRPTARQWVALLDSFERSLQRCSANSLHYYSPAAKNCTWCRMEDSVGIILFVPTVSLGSATPMVDPGAGGFNLAQVWASIERVQIPDPANLSPPIPQLQFGPSQAAKSIKQTQFGRRVIGIAAILIAVAVLYGASALWFVYVPIAWFGVVKAFSVPPHASELSSRYSKAEAALQSALSDWRRRMGAVEIHDRRKALKEARDRFSELPRLEGQALSEYERKRRETQLHRHLASYPIRRARIKGVGPARLATLASYGIDTADDVSRRSVLAVPGFGDASAQPLLDWRSKVEARFVYSVQPTLADQQATEQIRRNFAAEASKLRQTLLRGANELAVGIATVQSRIKAQDPIVNRAVADRDQAKADLEFLGQSLPKVILGSPTKTSTATNYKVAKPTVTRTASPTTPPNLKASNAKPTCPRCGGLMVRRMARQGPNAGRDFWGCNRFPSCRGTRPI